MTSSTDRETGSWREAFTRACRAGEGPHCPDVERFWAAATGEAGRRETRAMLDHAARCEACAEAWALALSMARDAGVQAPALSARAPGPVWRAWYVWAPSLAAAALLALGLWIDYRHLLDRRGPSPAWRGPTPAADIRSLVPEDRPLPRDAFVLRWSTGAAGTRYRVRVLSPDLALVSQADGLEAAAYQVPASSLARLPSGTRLLWQVEALERDGKRLTSQTFFVRLE